ncbi:hypothetical protein C5167_033152 [Papaver somniferum]|uniref:Nucleoporin Nup54 alpha-helical domain-containing protein n=1 Tax=Papaver somniferum TaxID=3469 RepID=A0A4Y7KDK3_PAPSO|nr:hypothetical protein C5167_033152 [Papaver somniferum]
MFGFGASPGFGTPSTPSFSPGGFGSSSLFSTPQTQQQSPFNLQQQQQTSTPTPGFGFQTPQSQNQPSFGFQTPQTQQTPNQQSPFGFLNQSTAPIPQFQPQLITQMAPVAPLPYSLPDRDIQAIVDAYKEEPGNPKYAFKHLLFSVTDPAARIKPAGVSDIMWAEAMAKLEGMESADREQLWPQLVLSFKDLSARLKIKDWTSSKGPIVAKLKHYVNSRGYTTVVGWHLYSSTFTKSFREVVATSMQLQDEVILSDAERLRMTQSNVKMLQRHFQADTLPTIQRMQQKEQSLQRRLLRLMRILEALEGKGCRLPLMKGEAELAEKIAAIIRQVRGSGAELSRRVHNLLSMSRVQANGTGGGSVYLPGSTKIHEESLADMQEVLQQQTEAIARLGNVLKRDMRDVEIIMAEDTEMTE